MNVVRVDVHAYVQISMKDFFLRMAVLQHLLWPNNCGRGSVC